MTPADHSGGPTPASPAPTSPVPAEPFSRTPSAPVPTSLAFTGLAPADLTLLRALLLRQAGLRLSAAQQRRAGGLLLALAQEVDLSSASALLLAARSNPALATLVAARFTVNETYFMRGGPQIDALRRDVLPELAARAQSSGRGPGRVTLWSAGCSSGEEAYTLALLAEEALPAAAGWQVEVLGSDLSESALVRARAGRYGAWSFRGLAEAERDRLLVRQAGERLSAGQPGGPLWAVRPATRARVRFRQHNLLDPAPVRAHLILCRNVTIYLDRGAVQRVYARLAEALMPGGLLLLAPTDPQPDPGLGLSPQHLGPGSSALWGREAQAAAPQAEARRRAERQRTAAGGLSSHTQPQPIPTAAPPPPLPAARAAQAAAPDSGEAAPGSAAPGEVPPSEMTPGELAPDELAPDELTQARQLVYLSPADPLAQLALAQALERAGMPSRARSGAAYSLSLLGALPQDTHFPGGLGWAQVRARALALEERLRLPQISGPPTSPKVQPPKAEAALQLQIDPPLQIDQSSQTDSPSPTLLEQP